MFFVFLSLKDLEETSSERSLARVKAGARDLANRGELVHRMMDVPWAMGNLLVFWAGA